MTAKRIDGIFHPIKKIKYEAIKKAFQEIDALNYGFIIGELPPKTQEKIISILRELAQKRAVAINEYLAQKYPEFHKVLIG